MNKLKSENGVYLFLEESEYISRYLVLKFYFSSEFYKNKFEREVDDYINIESQKLKHKYGVNVDFSYMLAIALYHKIEKRGFHVLYGDKKIHEETLFNVIL